MGYILALIKGVQNIIFLLILNFFSEIFIKNNDINNNQKNLTLNITFFILKN